MMCWSARPATSSYSAGLGDDVLISMPGNCFSRGTGADIVLGGGCDAGPEPAIAPLPRPTAETPEPGGALVGRNRVGGARRDEPNELQTRFDETPDPQGRCAPSD